MNNNNNFTATIGQTSFETMANMNYATPQQQQQPQPQQQQQHQQPQLSNNQQIIYITQQPNQQTSTNSSAILQQFANNQFTSFVQQTPQQLITQSSTTTIGQIKNTSCMQREIERLKKQNLELQNEMEKLRQAYTECQYQSMTDNIKLSNYWEQLEQIKKDKQMEEENKQYIFKNTEDQSQYCDDCGFEIKSQVALFIHKLNHCLISQSHLPRHLQLSTRSFTTMADETTSFKYRCHQCKIDSERQFQRHEIYMHIYQYHTYDVPYKCKICFLYFTSNTYLNEHLSEKHSIPITTTTTKLTNTSGPKNKRGRNFNDDNNNNNNNNSTNISSSTVQQTINVECLNSSLSLTALNYPLKRFKTSYHRSTTRKYNTDNRPTSISEIFQRLIDETSDTQKNDDNNKNDDTNDANKSFDNIKRDINLKQIMANLDNDKSLNCKYPGCNFSATTKSHLKFHISAHLMSKYKCPHCTFVGNRVSEIKRHIIKSTKHKNHHIYVCISCDFTTDCEKTFRDHYIRSHDSQADIKDIIEKMYLNESNGIIVQQQQQQSSNDDNNNNENEKSLSNNNNNNNNNDLLLSKE